MHEVGIASKPHDTLRQVSAKSRAIETNVIVEEINELTSLRLLLKKLGDEFSFAKFKIASDLTITGKKFVYSGKEKSIDIHLKPEKTSLVQNIANTTRTYQLESEFVSMKLKPRC